MTVQGPVKEQQPDGMSHRGALPLGSGAAGRCWWGGRPGQHAEGLGQVGRTHTEMRRGMEWPTRAVSAPQTPYNDPRNDQHSPQHTNYRAPLPRQRHHKAHRPQRPTERSDPTQHAK